MAKTAFLFPGQGAQHVGMAAELCSEVPASAALFEQANDILGYDLLELCAKGPADQLDATVYSQPALYVASLAALEKLRVEDDSVLASCDAAAGLSLGEYTALVFAGVLDFETGLRIVRERGDAMQAASDMAASGMVSILGVELKQVEEFVAEARGSDVLEIANHLCPGNIVVSGSESACERVKELAEAGGAMRVIPLAVAGAFHTSLMQPAVERLTAALASVELKTPRLQVVSNVDAIPHDDPEEIRQLLVSQVVNPVRWEDSIRYMINELEIGQFYEIGPGRVLKGLLKRIDRKMPCESVSS